MRDGKKPTQPSAEQSRFDSSYRFFVKTSASARAAASAVPSSSRKRKALDNANTVKDEVPSQPPQTIEEIQNSVMRLRESGEKFVGKIDQLEKLNDELLDFPEAKGNKKVHHVHRLVKFFIEDRRERTKAIPDIAMALEEILERRRAQQQSEDASSSQTTDEQPRAAPSP